MAAYSSHDLPNGHTLTIVEHRDGRAPTFAVQERDTSGTFLREVNERTLHDARMQVFAQRDALTERADVRAQAQS